MKNDGLTIYLAGKMAGLSIEEQTTWRKFVTAELDKYSDMANYKTNVISPCDYFNFEEPRDRKSTRLNSSHPTTSRMPSSA